MIPNGIYKHFKGGGYEVIGNAIHTETGESLVIYRSIDRPSPIWARPEKMWNEPVNGKPRFQLITEGETDA